MAQVVCVLAVVGCGGSGTPPDAGADGAMDADVDAGAPRVCAESTDSLELPTPLWEEGADTLAAPPGDRAVALLRARPSWAPQLSTLDGWPRRPTILIALEGDATGVDAAGVRLYDDTTSPPTLLDLPVEASIEGGSSLVIVPDDAFPATVERVIVSVEAAAVTGASLLPACAAGVAHPAYAEAATRILSPDVFALPMRLTRRAGELQALHGALMATPALIVMASSVLDLSALGELAPSADVLAALRTPVVDVSLELPAYQDVDGVFAHDAAGVPTAQGTIAPGITVMLPNTGTAPYPYVLYQHGGGQHRHIALHVVGPLLEAGFAVVAMDLPAHGDLAGAMGGSDLDILDFDDPLRSRDNLRQASADHLALLTGVSALNTALATHYGEPNVLDASRAYYAGLSLGGITGSMTYAAAPELRAAALFVAGGGYREILGDGLFKLILSDVIRARGASRQATLALLEALLGSADPLAHAALEAESGRARPLLLFEAIDDPIIPNPATDRWARAFGVDLALPSHHAVRSLTDRALPYTGTPTRVLIQAPMMEVAVPDRHGALIELGYSEQVVAHCFSGVRAAGACEVIDSGWAAH